MDRKIYETMQKIYNQKSNDYSNTNDVKFIGTMIYNEETPTGRVPTIHDIFVMTFRDKSGNITETFFSDTGKCIGGRGKDGKIYPSAEFAEADLSFLGQLERLSNNQGITFDELDKDLEKLAKELGISKYDIKDMPKIELDQKIGEMNKEQEQDKISLQEEDNGFSQEQVKQNEDALDRIDSKEEIDMNKLIDDRHSLADVLDVQAGSKLIAVYSDKIVNNTNSTRFSFVIQKPDGTLAPADMLEQTGGTDSDKTVYETNRDGSNISKVNVKSSFKINSPLIKNGILNIRYGSMGYVEVNYGEMDPTDHKYAFTQKLETDRDYYTTKEVRDEFAGREDGVHNIEENLDEIKMHEKAGCNDLTLEEADGHMETGNFHDSAIVEIKAYDPNIEEIFTDREIEERLHSMMENHPDESFDKVLNDTARDLSEDASHMRTRGEN